MFLDPGAKFMHIMGEIFRFGTPVWFSVCKHQSANLRYWTKTMKHCLPQQGQSSTHWSLSSVWSTFLSKKPDRQVCDSEKAIKEIGFSFDAVVCMWRCAAKWLCSPDKSLQTATTAKGNQLNVEFPLLSVFYIVLLFLISSDQF